MFCQITKKEYPEDEMVHISAIRQGIKFFILKENPGADENGFIHKLSLDEYRSRYIELLIKSDEESTVLLDEKILESIRRKEAEFKKLTLDISPDELSLGERLADKIARFGGSWTFITCFMLFIVLWMIVNVVILSKNEFDPYPFILLNLILSCLAAIQAPVIMMSQNRVEARDRKRSENDYLINLRAETEIQKLNEKIDHFIQKQIQHLSEIQEIQVEMLNEIYKNRNR